MNFLDPVSQRSALAWKSCTASGTQGGVRDTLPVSNHIAGDRHEGGNETGVINIFETVSHFFLRPKHYRGNKDRNT